MSCFIIVIFCLVYIPSIKPFPRNQLLVHRCKTRCFSSDKPKYQPREKRPRKTRFKSLEDYLHPHLVRPRIQSKEKRLVSSDEVIRDQYGVPIEKFFASRQIRSDISSRYGSKPVKRKGANQGEALKAGMTSPSKLRVMGGTACGTRLDSPRVHLRPMMGKAKESLFSSLVTSGIYDQPSVTHLDLFCGSGSLGIESLSRGAKQAVFVDLAKDCCTVAERNAKWCKFDWEGASRSICASVMDVLNDPMRFGLDSPFDIITLTPPYEEVSYSDLVTLLKDSPLIAKDSVVMIEYPVEMGPMPAQIGNLFGIRNRRFGRTVMATYICSPTDKLKLSINFREFYSKDKDREMQAIDKKYG